MPACAYQRVAEGPYDGALSETAPYPERVYYYEPSDTRHVYWYERGRPDVVLYRPILRERDRLYYVERDRGRDVKVYFDDHDARLHHHSN